VSAELGRLFDVIADCGLVGLSYSYDTHSDLGYIISVPVIDAPVAMQRLSICIERVEQKMCRTAAHAKQGQHTDQ